MCVGVGVWLCVLVHVRVWMCFYCACGEVWGECVGVKKCGGECGCEEVWG